ncbi:MAG TPA: DUF6766 family protein [Phycisphaerales bacterium]|nr:DUF6766 family protein [Phycisphaerales bacterium]
MVHTIVNSVSSGVFKMISDRRDFASRSMMMSAEYNLEIGVDREDVVSAPRKAQGRLACFVRNNALSLVVMAIFVVLAAVETVIGHLEMNHDLAEHGRARISYWGYLGTGMCWESLAENWESEFLEMGAFVFLSSCLFQLGSPESKDPRKKMTDYPMREDSPWPARKGGWIRAVYARSLATAFVILFVLAMGIHAVAGTYEYNRQQVQQGEREVSTWEFMGTSAFWFQSLQNWQSEFLGVGSMVLLSIWLRQQGSPESKDVDAPHWAHE